MYRVDKKAVRFISVMKRMVLYKAVKESCGYFVCIFPFRYTSETRMLSCKVRMEQFHRFWTDTANAVAFLNKEVNYHKVALKTSWIPIAMGPILIILSDNALPSMIFLIYFWEKLTMSISSSLLRSAKWSDFFTWVTCSMLNDSARYDRNPTLRLRDTQPFCLVHFPAAIPQAWEC